VQDSTDPHCDEVIEKCLASFRIDVLDWSKPDLDPEMLCNACPDVKELHLRWGGNNAVLRSWGEQEGLRRLKDLRTIYLYHDQVFCLFCCGLFLSSMLIESRHPIIPSRTWKSLGSELPPPLLSLFLHR
jgi:hypothetical protein